MEGNVCEFGAYKCLDMIIEGPLEKLRKNLPVLITHCPSSLALMHALASSNSKSCNSSTLFAYSGSFFRLLLRFRANHSGRGRAVEDPEMVYTGTEDWFDNFIVV